MCNASYGMQHEQQHVSAIDQVMADYVKRNVEFLFNRKVTVIVENTEFKTRERQLDKSRVLKELLDDMKHTKTRELYLGGVVTKKIWECMFNPFFNNSSKAAYLSEWLPEVLNVSDYLEISELYKKAHEGIKIKIQCTIKDFATQPKKFDCYDALLPHLRTRCMEAFVQPIKMRSREISSSTEYTTFLWSSDFSRSITCHSLTNALDQISFVHRTDKNAQEFSITDSDIRTIVCSHDATKAAYIKNIIQAYYTPNPHSRDHYVTAQSEYRCATMVDDPNDRFIKLLFNKNGSLLITCTSLGKIETWDMHAQENHSEVRTYSLTKPLSSYQHNASISGMALSPDGKLLAIGSRDNIVSIYDVSKGFENITLLKKLEPASKSEPRTMEFSPDGTTLAVFSGSRQMRFWDVQTGNLLAELLEEVWEIEQIIFTADGKKCAYLYALGPKSKGVMLFDLSAGVKNIREMRFLTYGATEKSQNILRSMFDASNNLVVIHKPENNKVCTDTWKIDYSDYTTFKQALLIYYAQKCKAPCVSQYPGHMQEIYRTFTDEQKKELINVFTLQDKKES